MPMYSYTPEAVGRTAKIIFPAVTVLSLLAMILTASLSGAEYVRAALLAVILADILLFTKAVLTSYTYTVTDEEGRADLVITRRVGRKLLTVCRVSVAGGRLAADDKTAVPKGTAVYDYRPGLFPRRGYVFFPHEAEGGGAVRFLPDEVIINIIYRNGASR